MPYRICRTFTVESGHMLSRHAEACRFPHGHSRMIEVVVSRESLDENGMVVDFKALKLALESIIDRYDHSLAINSDDPAFAELTSRYPAEALVVFPGQDPTTEAMAKELYDKVSAVLAGGWSGRGYSIPSGMLTLERLRVWETANSWAEYAP